MREDNGSPLHWCRKFAANVFDWCHRGGLSGCICNGALRCWRPQRPWALTSAISGQVYRHIRKPNAVDGYKRMTLDGSAADDSSS